MHDNEPNSAARLRVSDAFFEILPAHVRIAALGSFIASVDEARNDDGGRHAAESSTTAALLSPIELG